MSEGEVLGPRATWAEHPIRIRRLDVLRREQVTPKMVRVVLGGPELDGFESHVPDEHVKLVFPDEDTGITRAPRQAENGMSLDWERPFPPTRDYTIRRYAREAGEVWIDFVVHAVGRASAWAQRAEPGDEIWVAGPRPSLIVPPDFTYQLLFADHTALPALARWLEELPESVRAFAVALVPDPAEQQPLPERDGIEVTWLHESVPSAPSFADVLETVRLPEGEHTYLWAAGEAGLLKPVRRWAKAHGFERGTSDVSGYWKHGKDGAVPTSRSARLAAEVRHLAAHALGREH